MSRKDFRIETDFSGIMERVREELENLGIDFEIPASFRFESDFLHKGPRVKVVAVDGSIKDTVDKMGEQTRDHVVMVRIDEQTSKRLDEWVETGAVKSRSEAAALFIREGLKVRESELAKVRDALKAVEDAKAQLKQRMQEVFGKGEVV